MAGGRAIDADEFRPALLYGVTGIPTQQLRRVLSELDRIGLVDVERCRLTMAGLVLAASSAARLKRQEDEEPDSQQIDRAA